MDKGFIQVVVPGVQVWRCTEAIDPRSGFTFRTIGNSEGRCVEIITSQNTMLFDRRLARQLAEAILAVCGPAEELESDLVEADMVEVIYDDHNHVTGFKPYIPRTGGHMSDVSAWIRKVRTDAGLPPSRLEFEPELPTNYDATQA